MIINNEFFFDINLEDGKYKLKGQLINKNRPKSFIVEKEKKKGKCIFERKEMTIKLKDISSIVDLEFDSSSLKTFITRKDNIPEYSIDYKYYKDIEENGKVYFGNTLVPKIVCKKELIETPVGKEDREIIPAKSETTTEQL